MVLEIAVTEIREPTYCFPVSKTPRFDVPVLGKDPSVQRGSPA